MIVSENDSLKKKLKWWLISVIAEVLIILLFWGVPFGIMFYNVWLGAILFIAGVFSSRRLINYLENRIGIFCSLQNPNRYNLVQVDFPYPFWFKKAAQTDQKTKNREQGCVQRKKHIQRHDR